MRDAVCSYWNFNRYDFEDLKFSMKALFTQLLVVFFLI